MSVYIQHKGLEMLTHDCCCCLLREAVVELDMPAGVADNEGFSTSRRTEVCPCCRL